MKPSVTPILDNRDAERVFLELMRRRPAYLPAWRPGEGQPGWALLRIFARYMRAVIERLNEAPDKNLLAFLGMLGVNLIPAQAARAPVVFKPLPNFGNGQVAAGSRLGAQVSGQSEPLVFETDSAIAVAAARLVEIKTLWPTRDEYADHTIEWAGGRPFTLFEKRRHVPHEFYLSHDTLLAFEGKATIEIEFELSTPGSEPLAIQWEYWDGEVWQPFRDFDSADESASRDGTDGLTRSGIITLRAECGRSEKTTVNGIDADWLRGRLNRPLAPDPARVLAEIDRIRIRSVLKNPHSLYEVKDLPDTEGFATEGFGAEQIVMAARLIDIEGDPVRAAAARLFQLSSEGIDLAETSTGVELPVQVQVGDDGGARFGGFDLDIGATYRFEVVEHTLPPIHYSFVAGERLTFLEFVFDFGFPADKAFSDALALDVTKTFYPFGQHPLPGSVFYLTSSNAFTKPGAKAEIWLKIARINATQPGSVELDAVDIRVAWEYWNGLAWVKLSTFDVVHLENQDDPGNENDPTLFKGDGLFSFTVPLDMSVTWVNGEEGQWIRARLIRGAYGFSRTVELAEDANFTIVEVVPPGISKLWLSYEYKSDWQRPEHCLTYNDFQFELHSNDVRWPGRFFPPFRPVADTTPALYLGFNQPLPNDLVSLYVDAQEQEGPMPPLVWEAWNGETWKELRASEETADLQRPGMVSFIAPDVPPRPKSTITGAIGFEITVEDALEAALFKAGDLLLVEQDKTRELGTVLQVQGELISLETPLSEVYTGGTVSLAPLPRFGTPLDWIRVRLKQDGAPPERIVNGIHLNATWASQVQTIENEMLGSGTGQANQVLFFTQVPVVSGERIEVRELEGARAEVELPILREELLKQGLNEDDMRVELDPRDGRVAEVWVRWQYRPHLYFSGPDDRHYTIERASGRLAFGGKGIGRIPTAGPNNIQARRYRAGGGVSGNVAAGRINQLLGGAPFVQEVTNPRAAEGGADGEVVTCVKSRGPETIRHQGRALSAPDFEALAREASPGVAAVRALPVTAPNLRPAAGWVTVIIVPQSEDPRPQPTFELRRQVHDYLAARAPATLSAQRIGVLGPSYLPIGVAAAVVPRNIREAGVVERRVRQAVERFLHPLSGGPEGRGWPFGRDVFLSDLAAVLEAVDGVDYVRDLELLLNGTPRGEQIAVPPDRIVVAGPLRIEMQAGERTRIE